jgi:hypothetical protein
MHERVPQGPRKSRNENLPLRGGGEVFGETGEEDARVSADAGFGVGLCFGKVAEEIVIEEPVVELLEGEEGKREDGSR